MSYLLYPQFILALWAPIAGYVAWRTALRHVPESAPQARFWVTWAFSVLPLLVWLVPYLPDSPLHHLPYRAPIVWGIYRAPASWDLLPWPALAVVLFGLPAWLFGLGAPLALVLGVGEQIPAALSLRRLPACRVDDVTVLRLPGLAAFTFGLLRPRVFVTEAVWSGPHREAVLAHEREHARRRDPLRFFVARGIQRGTVWYLPFWRQALRHLDFEAERACDECACQAVGRRAYAGALLAFADATPAPAPAASTALLSFAHHPTAADLGLLGRTRALAYAGAASPPVLFWPAFALLYLAILMLL